MYKQPKEVADEYSFRKKCDYYVQLMDYERNILEEQIVKGLFKAEQVGREILEGKDETVFVRISSIERPELCDFLTVERLKRLKGEYNG